MKSDRVRPVAVVGGATVRFVANAVAVDVPAGRRDANVILLAPFLLARCPACAVVANLALERLAARRFLAVAGLPLAPSTGGHEGADQQPEDEYQGDNDPLVRGEYDHLPLPLCNDAGIQRSKRC
jgi:hypothetical protein